MVRKPCISYMTGAGDVDSELIQLAALGHVLLHRPVHQKLIGAPQGERLPIVEAVEALASGSVAAASFLAS